jgi:HK97 family phage prohead protease
MPYFISDDAKGCSGWATIKEDGEVIGCHTTKQKAIDQMVAVSIAEEIEPGGERLKHTKKKKMMYRVLPENYRPSLSEDVPEGRACGNCIFYKEDDVKEFADGELRAWCEKWDDYVNGAYYCNAWQPSEEDLDDEELEDEMDEERAPAPKKEQIKGSDKNKAGSAKGAGGKITFDEKTTTGLRNKVKEHNEDMASKNKPDWTRTTLGQLKSVYRRGAGAYSSSFRPGMTRGGWAMARVNAFLHLLRNGRPKNPNYVQDNDLLPKNHPKSTRDFSFDNTRAINQDAPEYMRNAAKRGLELNADGKGGGGLTDKTIREARLMADGQVSDDKWIRIAAWIARHLVDLDAPQNSNREDKGYPGAGLVAHLLWGSGPSKSDAIRTMNYAKSVVERIREEQSKRWSSVNILLSKEQESNMKTKVERRVKNDVDFELRIENGQSDGMRFAGYAAVFNSDSQPLPFTERILPGAFKKSLKSRNEIKLFMNHNMDKVLGSTRAKTLKLTEDSKGLLAEAILPDTTDGRDLSVLMQRGDVNSMSFGFSVPQGGDLWSGDGQTRELKEVRLHEVSIVTGFPAYQSTTATVRSLDVLADLVHLDPNMVSEAISKLEEGLELNHFEADLVIEIVSKLREETRTDEDDDNISIVDKVVQEELASLEIKRKHLDLLFKASQ